MYRSLASPMCRVYVYTNPAGPKVKLPPGSSLGFLWPQRGRLAPQDPFYTTDCRHLPPGSSHWLPPAAARPPVPQDPSTRQAADDRERTRSSAPAPSRSPCGHGPTLLRPRPGHDPTHSSPFRQAPQVPSDGPTAPFLGSGPTLLRPTSASDPSLPLVMIGGTPPAPLQTRPYPSRASAGTVILPTFSSRSGDGPTAPSSSSSALPFSGHLTGSDPNPPAQQRTGDGPSAFPSSDAALPFSGKRQSSDPTHPPVWIG